MEQAVEWVRRCPDPTPSASETEILPLFEVSDCGE